LALIKGLVDTGEKWGQLVNKEGALQMPFICTSGCPAEHPEKRCAEIRLMPIVAYFKLHPFLQQKQYSFFNIHTLGIFEEQC
jgi:hypothetical protein